MAFVVELYDAAEWMHDLHVLQCQKARDEPSGDVDEKNRRRPTYLCLWVHDADALLVDDDPDLVWPTGLKRLLRRGHVDRVTSGTQSVSGVSFFWFC